MFDAAAAGGIIFTAATGVDANAIAEVQARARRWLLRVFMRRGLLPGDDAQAMGQWEHGGGFSVDGSVRVEAVDHARRERLLRYCAWPPFALDRLRELGPERLLYKVTKPGPGGGGSLRLTPVELIDRIATLVPPPRVHRHRYFACWRERPLTGNFHGDVDRLKLAGLRRPPCRPDRPLIGTLLPSKRGRQVWIVEPPLSAGAWLALTGLFC